PLNRRTDEVEPHLALLEQGVDTRRGPVGHRQLNSFGPKLLPPHTRQACMYMKLSQTRAFRVYGIANITYTIYVQSHTRLEIGRNGYRRRGLRVEVGRSRCRAHA